MPNTNSSSLRPDDCPPSRHCWPSFAQRFAEKLPLLVRGRTFDGWFPMLVEDYLDEPKHTAWLNAIYTFRLLFGTLVCFRHSLQDRLAVSPRLASGLTAFACFTFIQALAIPSIAGHIRPGEGYLLIAALLCLAIFFLAFIAEPSNPLFAHVLFLAFASETVICWLERGSLFGILALGVSIRMAMNLQTYAMRWKQHLHSEVARLRAQIDQLFAKHPEETELRRCFTDALDQVGQPGCLRTYLTLIKLHLMKTQCLLSADSGPGTQVSSKNSRTASS